MLIFRGWRAHILSQMPNVHVIRWQVTSIWWLHFRHVFLLWRMIFIVWWCHLSHVLALWWQVFTQWHCHMFHIIILRWMVACFGRSHLLHMLVGRRKISGRRRLHFLNIAGIQARSLVVFAWSFHLLHVPRIRGEVGFKWQRHQFHIFLDCRSVCIIRESLCCLVFCMWSLVIMMWWCH